MCLSIKAGRAAHSFATSVTSVDLNLFVQGLAGCSRHRSCSLILQSWNWQRALSKWAWTCWNQDSGHESWIRIERRSSLFQEWCTFIAPGRNLLGNAPELQSKAESVTSVEVELVAQRGSFFTEASTITITFISFFVSFCFLFFLPCFDALMPVLRVWFGFCFALPTVGA